jgi:hypothetical protein
MVIHKDGEFIEELTDRPQRFKGDPTPYYERRDRR